MGINPARKACRLRNAFSAFKGQIRSAPSDKVVIKERMGSEPHENEANGFSSGDCEALGSIACGFSQTWIPLLSVFSFVQPFLSRTGIYCGTLTNPQRTP